jgi:3-hydroxyacyl-[acyl-carrier-protein] dehydratase
MPPEPLLDLTKLKTDVVLADRAAIETVNPQRFEMMQLSAIVHVDQANHTIVGYKDVGPDEFWVRGHMPGYPLMPGVIMCEIGAQLMSYYIRKYSIVPNEMILFSGINAVKFRGQVRVGDRFFMVCHASRLTRRQVVSQVQGFVGGKMVFEGEMVGMPFSPSAQAAGSEDAA